MRAKEIADHFFVEDDHRNKNLEIMILRYLEEISSHKDVRIAALEKVVGYLLPKVEYSNDGNCPECDVYHKEHLDGCPLIKARAVLEWK